MATTTPNFGWPVPTSADLVKNGATAIEGLGDAIDASLLDLKGGTTGQILSKTSNTDMDFTWVAAASGGGKVLQVVSATTATQTTINTATFTDTALSVNITPSSASSRVMVLVTQGYTGSRTDSGMDFAFRLNRGATTVYAPHQTANIITEGFSLSGVTSIGAYYGVLAISYVDSPASTSALTYKTQASLRTTSNSGNLVIQQNGFTSSIIALEIGA